MSAVGRSPEEVAELYAYNRWANGRVLEAASALTAEELSRQIGGSFSSLLGTLTHLVGAEWLWLERWHGRSPRALPAGFAGLEELRAGLADVEAGQKELLAALTPARLAEKITYVNLAGETWTYALGEMLVHLVNHGTYHRGQVASLLRQLDKKPLSTDYL
ncbi:MAG: DinB family protein, partial [Thermoanaerobaculia bacterium]